MTTAKSFDILTINAGSSSIKFALIRLPAEQRLIEGQLEQIGGSTSPLSYQHHGRSQQLAETPVADHAAGFAAVFELLDQLGLLAPDTAPAAIGHRIVHGGPGFAETARIDDRVQTEIAAASRLAPLHATAALDGLRAARQSLPDIPQIAVFDTGFHHDLPERASCYGLPLDLQRELGIRRYGFHGLSHRQAAHAAAHWLGQPLNTLKLITLHLGSGASACAINGGQSVDTSMGFTPLEGLLMGTRCGDLDPALVPLIAERRQWPPQRIEQLLNQDSGLLGLCGDSDMRRIEQRMAAGDRQARRAFEIFCYRIRKYVGAYLAVLNGLDALIFTAGIGEHSAAVRAAVCQDMDALGIVLDASRNSKIVPGPRTISPEDARIPVLVIPSDEALEIARAAHRCLEGVD